MNYYIHAECYYDHYDLLWTKETQMMAASSELRIVLGPELEPVKTAHNNPSDVLSGKRNANESSILRSADHSRPLGLDAFPKGHRTITHQGDSPGNPTPPVCPSRQQTEDKSSV